MFIKTNYYMDKMNGDIIDNLFRNIEAEYPGVETMAAEDFRVENNVKTRYVTIPGVLEFKFDIELPLFTADRKIATIYVLNYRGRDLLSRTPIQLYQSTGTSRYLCSGKSICNMWLPYDGRSTKRSNIKKPEDKIYGFDLANFLERCKNIFTSSTEPYRYADSPDDLKRHKDRIEYNKRELIPIANKLLPHILKLSKYFRFMDIDYALSSYLVSKYEYEPLEKTQEQIAQETEESEAVFRTFNPFFGFSPPSTHKFYYNKYIKYKNKYLELKKLK